MCRDTRQWAHRVGVSLRSPPPKRPCMRLRNRQFPSTAPEAQRVSFRSPCRSADHMRTPVPQARLTASTALAGRLAVASDLCSDHSGPTRDFSLRHQSRDSYGFCDFWRSVPAPLDDIRPRQSARSPWLLGNYLHAYARRRIYLTAFRGRYRAWQFLAGSPHGTAAFRLLFVAPAPCASRASDSR